MPSPPPSPLLARRVAFGAPSPSPPLEQSPAHSPESDFPPLAGAPTLELPAACATDPTSLAAWAPAELFLHLAPWAELVGPLRTRLTAAIAAADAMQESIALSSQPEAQQQQRSHQSDLKAGSRTAATAAGTAHTTHAAHEATAASAPPPSKSRSSAVPGRHAEVTPADLRQWLGVWFAAGCSVAETPEACWAGEEAARQPYPLPDLTRAFPLARFRALTRAAAACMDCGEEDVDSDQEEADTADLGVATREHLRERRHADATSGQTTVNSGQGSPPSKRAATVSSSAASDDSRSRRLCPPDTSAWLRGLAGRARRVDLVAATTAHLGSLFEASHAALGALRVSDTTALLFLVDVTLGFVFALKPCSATAPRAVDLVGLVAAHGMTAECSRIVTVHAHGLPPAASAALWPTAAQLAQDNFLFAFGGVGGRIDSTGGSALPRGVTRLAPAAAPAPTYATADLHALATDAALDLSQGVEEARCIAQEVLNQTLRLPSLSALTEAAGAGPGLGCLLRLWEYNAWQVRLRFSELPPLSPAQFRAQLAQQLLRPGTRRA